MAFQALLSVTVIQFLQASSAVSSFTLAGVKLQLSSAFHPQSDGQSEAINKVIAMLRCLVGDRPHQWLHWLARAEYCYNMAFHSSLKTSPFCVVYDRDPPSLLSYVHGEAQLPAVHRQLHDRDKFLQEIRERLEQAQARYKYQNDRHHRELDFEVGEWGWLRLLHRPIASLQGASRGKLGPKFYGLFRVLERVRTVAISYNCQHELNCTMFFMLAF
jgi:hypothetical protein